MRFLLPQLLLLIIPCLIIAGIAIQIPRSRQRQLMKLGDLSLIATLLNRAGTSRRGIVRHLLWLIAAAALVLALARPLWGQEIELVPRGEVAVMLMLDVSRSMNAQDVSPSRLERTRLFAVDIMRRLSGTEVGLMLFAGRAILQSPLTTDLNTIDLFIRNASSSAIQRQGTNFQAAFELASQSLNSPYATTRYVLLLTDGEDHEGGLEPVLQGLSDQQIRVIVVGIGTESGAVVPLEGGSILRDGDGVEVVSRLNEQSLREIAERTGGVYWSLVDAEVNAETFTQLFRSTTQIEGSTGSNVIEVERFGVFVLLAVLALALESSLRLQPPVQMRAVK